jgi:Ni/Co efflux regulator RcnB
MKRALAAAAIALSLFAGSVAIADDRDHGRNYDRSHDRRHDDRRGDHGRNHDGRRDHDRRDWHNDNRRDSRNDHRRDWRNDHDRRDWRHDYRRDNRHDFRNDRRHDHRYDGRYDRRFDRHYDRYRYRGPAYHRPHGYRAHYWRRGDYLPVSYRHGGYIVDDYYSYGLSRPSRGYHWVRVDNDVVLAAITTGIVLDIAYNRFY